MFVHTEVCALACVRARVFSLHVCSDISPSVCVMAGSPPAAVNTSYFQTVFKKASLRHKPGNARHTGGGSLRDSKSSWFYPLFSPPPLHSTAIGLAIWITVICRGIFDNTWRFREVSQSCWPSLWDTRLFFFVCLMVCPFLSAPSVLSQSLLTFLTLCFCRLPQSQVCPRAEVQSPGARKWPSWEKTSAPAAASTFSSETRRASSSGETFSSCAHFLP